MNESGKLVTSVYGSWGRGGGSGALSVTDLNGNRGRLRNDPDLNDQMNFDAYAANNVNGADNAFVYNANGTIDEVLRGNRAYSILRNSWNNHNWYGIMSVYEQGFGDNFKLTAGLDGRIYNSEHFRDVRNLLGGDYFIETGFDEGQTVQFIDQDGNFEQIENARIQRVGDKVAYHYETSIDYIGAFASGEYESEVISAYVSGAVPNSWYQRTELMSPERASILEGGAPQTESEVLSFLGYTAKAGANFKLGDDHNIFVNGGYFERPPFFRFVFVNSRESHQTVIEPENEKVTSAELGYGLNLRNLKANINGYYTLWDDKGFRVPVTQNDGTIGIVSLPGISAQHMGVEFDFEAKLLKQFTLTGQVSVGDWRWTNDVTAFVQNEETQEVDTVNLYLDNVRVGDAAQTSAALGLRWQPTPWFYTIADVTHFDNIFANFSPESRDSEPVDDQGNLTEAPQPWQLPSFTLLDLHAGFTFPIGDKMEGQLRLSLINALNTEYIMEAQDGVDQNRATARGFYGFGRNYNVALQINF